MNPSTCHSERSEAEERDISRNRGQSPLPELGLAPRSQVALGNALVPKASVRLRLCGCWINDPSHLRNAVRREAALLSMLANHLFIRRDVDAVDLVIGHVTLEPLNLRSQLLQHSTGLLRDALKLLWRQLSCFGNLPFDYVFRHKQSSFVRGKDQPGSGFKARPLWRLINPSKTNPHPTLIRQPYSRRIKGLLPYIEHLGLTVSLS